MPEGDYEALENGEQGVESDEIEQDDALGFGFTPVLLISMLTRLADRNDRYTRLHGTRS